MERQQTTKTNRGNQQTEAPSSAKPVSSIGSSAHPILQLQQRMGNQAVGRFLQAKLSVGQPGDVYEQEADRVADQVMRMPDPHGTEKASVLAQAQVPIMQRRCSECEEARPRPSNNEEEETLQAREVPGHAPQVTPDVEARLNALRGSGQPLPEPVRAFFEPRFGYDFSRVRVHSDARAAESASTINALAYTVDNDIVFGPGQYAPHSDEGKRLLAHELAHTIQQDGPTPARVQRRATPFNADSIAQQLREAMQGLGTDEESIYAALSGRTQAQVDEIAAAYQRLTGRSLQADLKEELTSGELRRLGALAPTGSDSLERRADMVAEQLRHAIEGPGTDETAIYSALNGRTPDELTAIKAAYLRLTRRELLDDLRDDLSGDELERALGQMDIAPTVYEQNTELGGLSVGNFDFHFKNCRALVWVWLKFQFTNDINSAEQQAFKRRFVDAVHDQWAHSGYSLSGSGSCPCSSVPIEIHAEENTGNFYHKLVDVERQTDEERRPKVILDINVNLNTDNHTLAHEFGHVLGLYDEYDGGFFENIMFWHRNQPGDPNALMNVGTELRPRYFEHYRARVQATAPPGCDYRISSPPPGP